MRLTAYICVSPRGSPIPTTIRNTMDESWNILRSSIMDPDTLIDKGWKLHRVSYVVEEEVT